MGQRRAQCGPGVLQRPLRRGLVAAFAYRAAAAALLGSMGVLALGAALTDLAYLVQPAPDIGCGQLVKPLGAQVRDDVETGEQLVELVGLRREVRLDHFAEPIGQVFAQCRQVRGDRAAVSLSAKPAPGSLGVLVSDSLDVLAAADAIWAGNPGVGTPATWDRVDRSLAVAA